MIQPRPKSYRQDASQHPTELIEPRAWDGHDREMILGVHMGSPWFTNIFLAQHAGYLQKSVALNLFPESMYLSRTQSTLIRCWERDFSNSQAVGKDKHRPIDRSRSKEESSLEL